jgi:superfamily I DNA/RNA helicase
VAEFFRPFDRPITPPRPRILRSESRKKLILAGPGTGKTFVFRKLLEAAPGDRKTRLVLTFINNLKNDLEESLSDLACVFTLHGYSQSLLYRKPGLRAGLTSEFRYLPGLASLIKADWEVLHGTTAPRFVEKMRELADDEDVAFYLSRGNYYDAVDFDDSVFRAYRGLANGVAAVDTFDLVLIDEYQDFNRMEAGLIDLVAEANPIVIAGDDDQALYSQLRGASWEFIRSLHGGGEYEVFELPFCLRCPEVIVHAVNDVIERAKHLRKLEGRIDKPYRPYAPLKGSDSERYPTLGLVQTTVQNKKTNYFGCYIEAEVLRIPEEEVQEATKQEISPVLVIGPMQYRRQIEDYLTARGLTVGTRHEAEGRLTRQAGLEILAEDADSNLGWRIVLEFENKGTRDELIGRVGDEALASVLPTEFRHRVLDEVAALAAPADEPLGNQDEAQQEDKETRPPVVQLTSFEGAKGLSAQHVYIVGLHEGELPHDEANIQDIEICRFIVGLTRARKRCSLTLTRNFAGKWKRPSVFLGWIEDSRYELLKVNKQYWEDAR